MIQIFQQGQQASQSVFMKALLALQNIGAGVLVSTEAARLNTLVEFDKRIQAINGRRVRAWRVISKGQAIKFAVSDFADIDQANTTSTVRADSASVSLKERTIPAKAVIKSNVFSSDRGDIEALDSSGIIFRVHTDDFSTPTGEFDIQLVTPLTLNQFIIDIVATPSTPTILVSASSDGLTYTPASQIAINGYVVTVWLPSIETQFIKIQVTPSLPDELNGNTFTFGVTNFSAQATDYHLRSTFLTKILQFTPKSEFLVFNTIPNPSLQFYLSVYAEGSLSAPFVEINPGDAVQIGTAVNTTITTTPSSPSLIADTPANLYLNTVVVKENGIPLRIAPNLLPTDLLISQLQHEYIGIVPTSVGYSLELIRSDQNYNAPRTFEVSYIFGPQLVNVQLKVQFSTSDSATSPIFHGASLDEV